MCGARWCGERGLELPESHKSGPPEQEDSAGESSLTNQRLVAFKVTGALLLSRSAQAAGVTCPDNCSERKSDKGGVPCESRDKAIRERCVENSVSGPGSNNPGSR